MSKKNKEYWNRRFLMDKALIINDVEAYLAGKQKEIYTAAGQEIQSQIEGFYRRYAKENRVSMADARQMIGRTELKKVDWKRFTGCQATDKLPDDVAEAMEKCHLEYEQMINAMSKKGSIRRLELLQAQIDKVILELYDANQRNLYDLLAEQYENTYYKSVYNTQQCIGYGSDFAALNREAVDTAILHQYSRGNYSTRIYAHTKNLSDEIKKALTTGMITGENLDKLARRVQRRLEVSHSNARRLVRTETAYVYEQAARKAYEECGVEKYEYLATLDHRTSEACRKLDGKVFAVKDAMPGKNYPPMHPNCRSTTVCSFDGDQITSRLAKDAGGKYYEVPSNMTYKQWEKAAAGLDKNAEYFIKAQQNGVNITNERITIFQAIGSVPQKVQDAIKETEIVVGKYTDSRYDYENDTMYIAKGAGKTEVIHEIGHLVDSKLIIPDKVLQIQKNLMPEIDIDDIIEETYYDAENNPVTILLVKNESLISEYQGRIYVKSRKDAFNKDGSFRYELMWEFISEPFREYVENPDKLSEKSPLLFELIRGVVQ